MFVLNSEYRPHASAADFRESDDEAHHRRVADVVCEDGVEYPVEANDNVHNHGDIINPWPMEGQDFAEHWSLCIRIA